MLVLAAACNSGDDDPTIVAGEGSTTSSSATTATSEPTTTSAPLTAPPLSTPPLAQRAHLTGVRAAVHDGADRVVFEFEPVVPGYKLDYAQRPVTEDGSGDEVPVSGAAVLEVRMENASGVRFEGERVVPTYTGPKRLRPSDASLVTELVFVGDFEGVLTWVVGLRQRVPALRVTTLSGPSRLVIDVPTSS